MLLPGPDRRHCSARAGYRQDPALQKGTQLALDARTGKVLWRFQTGGAIVAPPVTYLLAGKKYIAVAAGTSIVTFALP